MSKTRIIVEGWRFVPHSYAFVNHYQSAALARRADVELYHVDAPPPHAAWVQRDSLISPESDAIVRSLGPPPAGVVADAWLGVHSAYRLRSVPTTVARRTFTFGTCEYGIIPPPALGLPETQMPSVAGAEVTFITPSNWSCQGFLRCGAKAERVRVVPHGVDTRVFFPGDDGEKAAIRRDLQWPDASFVFLHVGAMTWNKGPDVLLPAFAAVLEKHSRALLVLKGTDAVYGSGGALRGYMMNLPEAARARVLERTVYIGESLPSEAIARLHRGADAYVCPYYGEGFNLPALEAAASGLAVIATAGGPTDDFLLPEFGRKVKSELKKFGKGQQGFFLKPSVESLVGHMLAVMGDDGFRAGARQAGPAHVRERYTWDKVAEQLVGVLRA